MVHKNTLSIFLLVCLSILVSQSQAAVTCNKTYQKVGCYRRGNYLGNLLINDRDPNSSKNKGHLINWDKIEASLHSLACRCSAESRKLKYKFFGIRFYAECWAGNNIPLDKTQMVHTCFQGQNISTCNNNSTLECAGKQEDNYIYKLLPNKTNGGFSNWTRNGKCNASCGWGNQKWVRKCDNPAPKNGGTACIGKTIEYRPCFIKHCPVNGGFSSWSTWGNCSVRCGGGKQSRTRKCNNPEPKHGGLPCVGSTQENRTCNTKSCHASKTRLRRVCEDRVLYIKCPFGKRIHISHALYGRKTRKYCNVPRCQTRNIRCKATSSLSQLQRRCGKRRMCLVLANNWTFGEPCGQTSKYLEVQYSCV